MEFEPVWFDSLGAKSSCTLVKGDVGILIDPGVSQMHPGFPASDAQKHRWFEEASTRIRSAAEDVDVVVVSHYHYDHFIDFERQIYADKTVLVKSPNDYINDSQRGRAEKFFEHLCDALTGEALQKFLEEPRPASYKDPMDELRIARNKDFGEYQRRREGLLGKGRRWFRKRAQKWSRYRRIPELEVGDTTVKFLDGQEFRFGDTKVRFSKPHFHGIEYSRVGWVCSIVVEQGGEKLIHTSDLNGPIIEDYAEWIVEENPQVVIVDGPMTYMLGYTMNLINLRRALDNMLRIVKETDARVIIYDHHLVREAKFREHTAEVWSKAEELGRRLVTAAEFAGRDVAVLSAGERGG